VVVIGDVTDPATAASLASAIGDDPLDLVVNNAGLGGGSPTLATIRTEDLDTSFATNVTGPMYIVRACHPALCAAGGGLVVNVSSRLASIARQAADYYHQAERQTSYAYRITKAAQNMLTVVLAQELRDDAIAVWALHPGTLTTRLGTERADTPPEVAATALVDIVTRRDLADLRPRFISLDARERPGGDDLPW
jgi:NAD(P)-dependent dehydrogenase (short-subunit alcohol dehydrogenase family)